uniref:Hydrolase_4 domain-containing protein n=1 Tax=Panagrellus redivivus TaxID=6233 RepID=A0A7E4VB12_PANRE
MTTFTVLAVAFICLFIPNGGYGRIEDPFFIDEYGTMVIPKDNNPYFVGIPIDSADIIEAVEDAERELYALDERFGEICADRDDLVLQIQVFSVPDDQLDDAKVAFRAGVTRFTQNYGNFSRGFEVEFRGVTSFNGEVLITKPLTRQNWIFTTLQEYFDESFKAKKITKLSLFTVTPHLKIAQLKDTDSDLSGVWDSLTNPLMPFGVQNVTRRISRVWTYFVNHWRDFWPPTPSVIASRVAFHPPVPPSYNIVEVDGRDTIELSDNNGPTLTSEQRLSIEIFTTETRNRNTIVCMFIPFKNPRYTLFISHGNDVDIGNRCGFYYQLGINLECNVFAYDYSGYGHSTGRASEANMYTDADAALIALTDRYGMTEQQIVFYGHSLGTAAAIELASRFPAVAGLILIAPFKSGLRVFFPDMPFTCCFDCFPNIDRMKNVMCRTLIIEPGNDDLFGPNSGHADALCARLRRTEEVVQIEGGYNDIEESDDCLAYLHHFITEEAGPLSP